jgi:hypothetical protein
MIQKTKVLPYQRSDSDTPKQTHIGHFAERSDTAVSQSTDSTHFFNTTSLTDSPALVR